MHHLHTQFVASCPSHNHSIPGILLQSSQAGNFCVIVCERLQVHTRLNELRGKCDLYFNPQDESKRGVAQANAENFKSTEDRAIETKTEQEGRKLADYDPDPLVVDGKCAISAQVLRLTYLLIVEAGKYATGGRFWLLIVHGSHPSTRYLDSTHDAATAAARRPYLTHRPFDPDDRFAGMVTPNA